MSPERLAILFAGLLMTAAGHAQRPAFLDQALAVEIEADAAELSEERGVSTYHGNVVLRRGPLEMRGRRLEIRRDEASGKIEARLSGQPARAVHRTDTQESPVIAEAREIIYTTIVEVLELNGTARIQRGEDQLSGESVRYDVANARIQASGGDERVRILITPPEKPPGKAP